jgi:hypothetical protein
LILASDLNQVYTLILPVTKMRDIMKYTGIFVFTVLLGIISIHVQAKDGKKKNPPSSDTTDVAFEFIYTAHEPWKQYDDYSKKDAMIFGEVIALQLCMIDHQYVVFSNSDNTYRPNIIKPAIYSSLSKLKQHYKSLLKKGLIDQSTVRKELGNYLIIGYACYAEDTEEIEHQLNDAGSVEEIKEVLNQIILITDIQ